jgi:hypothetical protein
MDPVEPRAAVDSGIGQHPTLQQARTGSDATAATSQMRIILRSVRYAGLCSRGWAAVPWHGELVSFAALPEAAAWRHHEARSGFEVAYFRRIDNGCCHIEGWTTAVEDEKAWVVDYEIEVDDAWATRRARVTGHSPSGSRSTLLEADGAGTWRIDGQAAPHLEGCLAVDLESSAFTNALPVHRMQPSIGERSAAPAAYIRVKSLAVQRLEQTYPRQRRRAAAAVHVRRGGVRLCLPVGLRRFRPRPRLPRDRRPRRMMRA